MVCLDSAIYFREMWGIGKVPREGVERDTFHMALMTLVEQTWHGRPDLICLAGYDLWTGGWMVRRYYPRILNVHPGDAPTYTGLAWRPTAKAILAGEGSVKSTVFFVDESDDGGPILIQSASLPLSPWDEDLRDIRKFSEKAGARTLPEFQEAAQREGNSFYKRLEEVSSAVQEAQSRRRLADIPLCRTRSHRERPRRSRGQARLHRRSRDAGERVAGRSPRLCRPHRMIRALCRGEVSLRQGIPHGRPFFRALERHFPRIEEDCCERR